MTMHLELPPQLVEQLRQRAATTGEAPEAIVLQALQEKFTPEPVRPRLSPEEFAAKLQEIMDLHPRVTHFVDDSRESIYEGCGE